MVVAACMQRRGNVCTKKLSNVSGMDGCKMCPIIVTTRATPKLKFYRLSRMAIEGTARRYILALWIRIPREHMCILRSVSEPFFFFPFSVQKFVGRRVKVLSIRLTHRVSQARFVVLQSANYTLLAVGKSSLFCVKVVPFFAFIRAFFVAGCVCISRRYNFSFPLKSLPGAGTCEFVPRHRRRRATKFV